MPPGGVIVEPPRPLHDSLTVPAALARYRNEKRTSVANACARRDGGRALCSGGIRGAPRPGLAPLWRGVPSIHQLGRQQRVLRLPESRLRERDNRMEALGQRLDRGCERAVARLRSRDPRPPARARRHRQQLLAARQPPRSVDPLVRAQLWRQRAAAGAGRLPRAPRQPDWAAERRQPLAEWLLELAADPTRVLCPRAALAHYLGPSCADLEGDGRKLADR